MSTILLISLSLIPISLLVPKINSIPPQAILVDNTINHQLSSNSFWLKSLDIELVGEDRCMAEVLSVNCDEIIDNRIDIEETQFVSDYIYLTKGATMTFEQKLFDNASQYYPKYIWVFDNLNNAEANLANNFERLACLEPPEGVFCLRIDNQNGTSTFTVPDTSYYFVRCFHDHDCNFLSNMTIANNTVHDYDATLVNRIDSKQIISGNGNANLKIQRNIFRQQSTNSICVLVKLSDCDSSVYHVFLSGIRTTTFLIYSCLFCTLVLIILIICFVAWLLCLRYARSQTKQATKTRS